jgi:hypothetical protein
VRTLTGFCRGGRPWLFRTRGCCYWWETVPSGNVSFVKRILVGWLSGGWTQRCWDRFDWWPPRFRGIITSSEGLHNWGRQAVPLLSYTLAFALQLRKSTENLSQGSRVVGYCSLRRLGCIFMDSLDWLLNISPCKVRSTGKLALNPTAQGGRLYSKRWTRMMIWESDWLHYQ